MTFKDLLLQRNSFSFTNLEKSVTCINKYIFTEVLACVCFPLINSFIANTTILCLDLRIRNKSRIPRYVDIWFFILLYHLNKHAPHQYLAVKILNIIFQGWPIRARVRQFVDYMPREYEKWAFSAILVIFVIFQVLFGP